MRQRIWLWLRYAWLAVVMVPYWFTTRLAANLRCWVFGWHTSRVMWRLVYSDITDKPLYWVREIRCRHCGEFRPGSQILYRWRPEHGTGPAPERVAS